MGIFLGIYIPLGISLCIWGIHFGIFLLGISSFVFNDETVRLASLKAGVVSLFEKVALLMTASLLFPFGV